MLDLLRYMCQRTPKTVVKRDTKHNSSEKWRSLIDINRSEIISHSYGNGGNHGIMWERLVTVE